MKKKLLLFLLPLAFLQANASADTWDGKAAAWAKGTGTRQDPFLIESAANLAYLSQQVATGQTFANGYFQLTSDLDLNSLEWTPIGGRTSSGVVSTDYYFAGFLDGNKKVITNLKIDTPAKEYTALFGKIENSGAKTAGLQDLTIASGSVKGGYRTASFVSSLTNAVLKNCTNAAGITGTEATAGILGIGLDAEIINCTNSGNISGTEASGIFSHCQDCLVRNCTNTGTISGKETASGIGHSIYRDSSGDFMDCRNEGEVTGDLATGVFYAVQGQSPGIVRCSNSGKINAVKNAAGIVSALQCNEYSISDCYNTGDISSENNDAAGITLCAPRQIRSCYNTGLISSLKNAGAISPLVFEEGISVNCYYLDSSVKNPDPNGTVKTEEEMKESSLVRLLNDSHEYACWIAGDDANKEFPMLNLPPYYVTSEAENITPASATLKARFDAGNELIMSSGFIYQAIGEEKGAEINAEIINDTITAEITCKPNTQYQYSIYFMTFSGIHLGEVHQFTTPDNSDVKAIPEEYGFAYPNPVRGLLHIPLLLSGNEQSMLRIYNPAGRCIKEITLDRYSAEIIVDTAEYTAGTYIYQCGKSNGRFIVK